MTEWRFVESEVDGFAWLNNPRHLVAHVDYRSSVPSRLGDWYRLKVVTRSWMLRELAALEGIGKRERLFIPTVLVLPDGPPEVLRSLLDETLGHPSCDYYAVPLPA